MNDQISVVIADDHPIFRAGLRQIIESDPRFAVVAEAADGESALGFIQREKPAIVVLDINMPVMTGFVLAKEMRRLEIDCELVFLTMHAEEAMFNRAMDLGAKGYILKDSATVDIINCLQAVARGQNYASPAITTYLFKRAAAPKRAVAGIESLTPTEQVVLKQISLSKTSREIADDLCISLRTVENHRYNICQKLGISGSNALVKFALKRQSEI